MANFPIGFGANLVGKISLQGKDDSETIRGLTNVSVTLADATAAYIADAASGNNEFYIVPRQNVGGTPLAAVTTVTVTITGNDPVLGGALPPIAFSADLQLEPPPPPHSTHIEIGASNTVTLATVPPDPGTTTISLT